MARRPFAEIVVAAFAERPDLAEEFYLSASELLHDFDEFGPVVQSNEDGQYDESTEIEKLRQAYNEIAPLIAQLSLGELAQKDTPSA